MEREILNPRWANNDKSIILCNFKYADGRMLVASVSVPEGGTNPDWDEIIDTFGIDHIDNNSKKHIEDAERKRQNEDERRFENFDRMKKEALFNIKAEAFEIDIIKNSTNRELKNKIRRAGSMLEVQAYATAIILKEDPALNPNIVVK
jgi:hypothetical protein